MAPSCKQQTAKDLEVHRCVPAPFLTKTYQLVEDLSTDEIISWNDNGSTFVVWKAAEFARDLLPNYFKHNNFSSFVRQLNTYGFRKTVPDRWEFANEFFRRGEKELLSEIHRRKTTVVAQNPATGKINLPLSSPSNSGEDQGSSSTSSPSRKGGETANSNSNVSSLSELSDENEKLKKDNTKLSWELAETKKQCQELLNFLSKYVNVDPDYIRSVMEGGEGSNPDLLTRLNCTVPLRSISNSNSNSNSSARVSKLEEDEDEDEDEEEAEEGQRLKLFGVSLKVFQGKKRGRRDRKEEAPLKEMKMDLEAPWMKLSSPRGSKVCN